jgi:hypothetical protein
MRLAVAAAEHVGAVQARPVRGTDSGATVLQVEGYDTVSRRAWREAETYAMTVSASPDSSSCGTWPKAYLAPAVSVKVQITS